MRDYEERVVQERNDLAEKYEKLDQFISNNENYKLLPLMEKERLNLQRYVMGKYVDVLSDRIDYFQELGS